MQSIRTLIRSIFSRLTEIVRSIFQWFRNAPWLVKSLIVIGLAFIAFSLFSSPETDTGTDESPDGRFVTVATIEELSGDRAGSEIVGSVRAVQEAEVLARTGGTITGINTRLGAVIPAGFAIASIENASERAAVLQAEGAYEAAIAARNMHSLNDTEQAARDAYQAAYTVLDTTLENNVGSFFGGPTPTGPEFLLESASIDERYHFSRERDRIGDLIDDFKTRMATAPNRDPEALLDDSEALVRQIQILLTGIAEVANEHGSTVTQDQTEDLATARANIDSLLARISAARTGLRTETISATASADASVKQALGVLRAAEANLERTIVRAPIAGRIDFLPIRLGDYVTSLQHVATVAQSGSLEVIAYAPDALRNDLVVGDPVMINGVNEGIITAVAPALDPVTKQTEVRIAVTGGTTLIGGQSVRVTLQNDSADLEEAEQTVLLPLASVKLRAGDRVVFTVDSDSRLVAKPVVVGDVRGDRIEILSDIPADLDIVTDARGLAEGELVRITPHAS